MSIAQPKQDALQQLSPAEIDAEIRRAMAKCMAGYRDRQRAAARLGPQINGIQKAVDRIYRRLLRESNGG